jgi:HlyD family secretion protein
MKNVSKVNSVNKRRRAGRVWVPIVVIVFLVASGLGAYFYWKQQTAQTQTSSSDTLYTAQARQGNINISVTGSGTLTPSQEKNLAFSVSGTVDKVNVAVGDKVKKGDALAVLADLASLQDKINSATMNLSSAQQSLDTLKAGAASNLANAQLAVVTAQKAVTDANSNVVKNGWQRCDTKTTNAYYDQYVRAKAYLDTLGDGGGNQDYYNTTIVPQKNIVAQAWDKYNYCAGYTDYEISSSQASLAVAQANLTKAQSTLDTLTKNNGIDPVDLASAENKVSSAQLALDTAKENLAGATITAPFDGTVLSVAGLAGDSVDTSTFITIADLANPLVDFSVDEADMDKVDVDMAANVAFDALPNASFQGKVTRIDPALTTSGSYKVVTGVIALDLSKASSSADKLLSGLTGTVTLVQASAENVVLVPLAALRDLGGGSYAVFVVGSDGQPRMRVVEVGLKDSTYAEIKSGVKSGETVTTGTTQTK